MKQWFNDAVDYLAQGVIKIPDFIQPHSPTILSYFAYGAVFNAVWAASSSIAIGLGLSLIPGALVAYIPPVIIGLTVHKKVGKAVTRNCEEKGIVVALKKRDWSIGIPSFVIGCFATTLTISPSIKDNVEKIFNEKSSPIKKSANENVYNLQSGSGIFYSKKLLKI